MISTIFFRRLTLLSFELILALSSAYAAGYDDAMPQQSSSPTLEKCQNDAADVQRNAHCGTGDMACTARVENQMKRAVKTCIRAMEEMQPPLVPAATVSIQ